MAINRGTISADIERIGSRIRQIRRALEFNQKDFADFIGVSQSYLSEVENGKGKASMDMLVGISSRCGDINLKWLLSGEGSMWVDRFSINHIDRDALFVSIQSIERITSRNPQAHQGPISHYADSIAVGYEIVKNHLLALIASGITRSEALRMIRLEQSVPVDVDVLEPDEHAMGEAVAGENRHNDGLDSSHNSRPGQGGVTAPPKAGGGRSGR